MGKTMFARLSEHLSKLYPDKNVRKWTHRLSVIRYPLFAAKLRLELYYQNMSKQNVGIACALPHSDHGYQNKMVRIASREIVKLKNDRQTIC